MTASGRASPSPSAANGSRPHPTSTWSSAKGPTDHVHAHGHGYPSFSTRPSGFLGRHCRRLSESLPRFYRSSGGGGNRDFEHKEKLGRGRWSPANGGHWAANVASLLGKILRRMKLRAAVVLVFLLTLTLFYLTPLHHVYQSSRFLGGGGKFVILLAANEGGGVMTWKGPRQWAIERDSVKNKKSYAQRWGYHLEIVDMTTKKRYAHEWRESWEKVDTIRNSLRKYPKAEWFWWLDLNTLIMEPSYSLQSHIFHQLSSTTYRDINDFNPLNITHPFPASYLDPESRSVSGDGRDDSINLIVPQDCGGFNLGSFFIRRSAWTDRLLDVWWDPAAYEQKHMEWEHKEQDALEYLYANQAWIRPHTAFIAQRKINSFPPGACGDAGHNPRFHYDEHDRDFLVNMAGCEWGRDCWGEMHQYRQLSERLNRNRWEKVKDGVGQAWRRIWQTEEKKTETMTTEEAKKKQEKETTAPGEKKDGS
ncbi:MAG: alpha-1,6-mannosyltransferase [Phylliscum demangeonii]|nr:MAG: alpha-1,6-mannosyltransferase [Phylliscum demangeonii]